MSFPMDNQASLYVGYISLSCTKEHHYKNLTRMGRSPCCSKDAGLNRGAWTTDEDLILSEYIGIHGDGNWRALPKKAGLKRCGKSCRLRWLNYLRPDIKHGSISTDEDELIIKLHGLLGNRWSLIAGRLPGRTDNEIKNYWNKGLRKKLANIGSTVPQCRKINSLRPKSPSDPSRFKVNPVKTTAARIVKGLNKCKTTDNCNATPAHQDFTFLSDAPQIMKASKSWCDLLLDEMITENDLEFSETHNLFESNNLQYPHSQNSPQHRASTSKSFLSYRDYNLPTSQFDSSEDFMVDEFEARPSNDLKQMCPDINSNMQQVNSSTGCDEQMIEVIYCDE